MKKLISVLSLALLALSLSGCMSGPSGNIVAVKQRVLGISIEQSDTSQTPRFRVGLITSVYQLVPVNTNGPVYAPRYFDTFDVNQSWNPLAFGLQENSGFGDVAVSTNATGQAIIPKLARPQ